MTSWLVSATLSILWISLICKAQDEFRAGDGAADQVPMAAASSVRYLLYEVNPGEGFNLRRDVYLRMANLVKFLNDGKGESQWVLVLPPWGRIYHWQSGIQQEQIPWSHFFDIDSLRKHIPVMELVDWMKLVGTPSLVDEMYYLQDYTEGWVDGKWTERRDIRPCKDQHGYNTEKSGLTSGWFWGYGEELMAKKFQCLSVQSGIDNFKSFLRDETKGQSVMLHRAESLTHGKYSEWSKEWWLARRSVRFSKQLKDVGDQFRREHLDSDDERDLTVMDDDWTTQQRALGTAKGGPYLAVHLRRKDFLWHDVKDVPSLATAAKQIEALLTKLKLQKVFIATDAPQSEYSELKELLSKYEVYRFEPTKDQLNDLKDGGVAIVDQWIATHARHFTGTSVSTFSLRIHEERALLGFSPDSTYNRLCGEKEKKNDCQTNQPGRWFPKY